MMTSGGLKEKRKWRLQKDGAANVSIDFYRGGLDAGSWLAVPTPEGKGGRKRSLQAILLVQRYAVNKDCRQLVH